MNCLTATNSQNSYIINDISASMEVKIENIREQFIENFHGKEPEILAELARETNITQLHPRMLSGWYQGSVLAFLVKICNAQKVIEIGTFTGYSAICIAGALPEDGRLISIEKNDEVEDIAKKYFKRANLSDKITHIIGDAISIIPTLDDEYDFAFIDGDKREYNNYYHHILPKLKTGGLIVVDNVLWANKIFSEPASNDYMTKGIIEFNNMIKDDPSTEKIILPLRDGLMLLRKL